MERSPKRISDGSISFEAGVDTGRSPALVARNQVVWAINATMTGAFVTTRPGWRRFPFTLPDGSPVSGVFQCCRGYVNQEGQRFLVFLISGRVYLWEKRAKIATDITISGDPNPNIFLRGWMLQAEQFLIIQDGFSAPMIFDGANLRRAAPNEIKSGTIMSYVQGRIWYALPDGLSFRATDLVYSKGNVGDVLMETENTFLNEGGDFTVPQDSGGISGIGIPAVLNTSFGEGPILIMTPKYVCAINAPVDRTIWKALTYPIQTIALINYGTVADKSCVTVNGDVYYRAPDGIRSFYYGWRQFAQPGNTPISSEMNLLLNGDSPDLLPYCSGMTLNNRLLMTASPYFTNKGVLHRALSILEFNLISGMRQKLPPAWEGMWTGVNIHQLVKVDWGGIEDGYIISREGDGSIGIWEISKDADDDYPQPAQPTRIAMEMWSKAYDWDQPQYKKKLDSGEIWVDDVRGAVDFDVKFKPDQFPSWVCWNNWSECANIQTCGSSSGCVVPQNLSPQYRPKMRLPTPTDACDPVLGLPYRNLFDCQVRITVTGHARIKRIRINAIEIQESPVGECLTDSACSSLPANCSTEPCDCSMLTACGNDMFAYRSNP